VTSRQRPTATLTIAGQDLSTAEAALHRLTVELGIGAHDRAELVLGHLSPAAGTASGADVAVALGYAGTEEAVFTGHVVSVHQRPWGVVLEALGAPARLAGVRVGRSYLQRDLSDIVEDLAGEAGVTVGDLDADLRLPAYHVDERRSAWSHVRSLARLAAAEITTAPDGALDVRRPRSGDSADHTLRHGADLLAWSAGTAATVAPRPDVVAHGAASSMGAQAWHVVLKEPDGGAPDTFTLVPVAVRDTDAASTVAEWAARASVRQERTGRATAVGNPAIRAGHLVELADLPGAEEELDLVSAAVAAVGAAASGAVGGAASGAFGALAGAAGITPGKPSVYRVVACTHHLGPEGFVSELTLEGTA
jgi:hypothetical protein